ncbi:oligosaccharide flippase family protein [Providencia rettgeri]|uniref:oligosaccharide flippase family protein n=1 Tax=Providencia rettgeri TaxID=587 RepID=UPI0024AC44F6|nr:oligosaccharide flippase family protein [Providencia rettgeri]EJD6643642.1 oligosaccharide flippase family protein [Providencia rettgeri]MDT2035235.1 oligosaccharide flippase family protein [Providencia rettgeri]
MSHKKEIIKNILSFGSIDIFGLLIPIITMPILTRALGPYQYGIYMLIVTILYFGHTVIDYGTQYTAVRTLANNRKNQNNIKAIYSETQGLRIFLFSLYSILVVLYLIFFTNIESLPFIVASMLTYLLGYTITPVWFYQGIAAVDTAMKISLLVKLINLLVIILFVKTPNDIIIVIASLCIPMLLGGVILSYIAHKKYHVRYPIFTKLRMSLSNGFDVFLGLLAPNLYNSIPTIVLGTIYPPSEFVNFAIASRLASVVVTIQDVVAKALYPVLSRIKESPVIKLLLLNSIISIFPIAFLLIWGERCLLFFLGKNFSDVNLYLIIFTIGVLFIGLSNAFSKGFFLPKGLDRIYRNISLRISILSAVICIFFIYYFGLIGGAISITLARFLFFMDYYLTYIKFKKNHC